MDTLLWAPKIYESEAVIEIGQETPKVSNTQDFSSDNLEVSDSLLIKEFVSERARAGPFRHGERSSPKGSR